MCWYCEILKIFWIYCELWHFLWTWILCLNFDTVCALGQCDLLYLDIVVLWNKVLEVNISYTSGTMAEFSTEELEAIGAALKDMNVKPKADSASDLKQWMVDYVTQMQGGGGNGGVKQEPGTGPATTSKLMTHHIPKVSCFSGDVSKQDTSYDLWRYEVDCLIKEKYSEEAIAQAIRRSLRGDAGKVAMRLGPEAKVDDILDKMESVFGSLERGEKVLEEFYSSTQRKDEDSMAWRLPPRGDFSQSRHQGSDEPLWGQRQTEVTLLEWPSSVAQGY